MVLLTCEWSYEDRVLRFDPVGAEDFIFQSKTTS